ncbi:MAG: hypothetical protein V7L22_20060 [Nostoc sp.]|uniref:hypothetical protein n=1 Tax=Nostoc sp. TaxID=1180 RepID=UPI002FF87F48
MIRARYPLLYVISVEEKPVEEVLQQVALRSVPKRQLLFWDIVRGWSDMRNLMGEFKRSPNIIITTSHTLELPDELLQEVTVVDFPLPREAVQ